MYRSCHCNLIFWADNKTTRYLILSEKTKLQENASIWPKAEKNFQKESQNFGSIQSRKKYTK